MPTYTYPSNIELTEIAQEKAAVLMADDVTARIMPMTPVDAHLIEWDQLDNFTGLQQVRGLNGQPQGVNLVGSKKYRMSPGVYGEFITLDEEDLTARRQLGTFGAPINISDLVAIAQDQLLNREIDRWRYIVWTLLSTGTFAVSRGATVYHTDTYPLQTSSGSDWSTAASSTPLADFRAVKLLGRGKGVNFNGSATAYMNQTTFNRMIGCQNSADLLSFRTGGLSTILGVAEVNRLLLQDDLPQIVIYDEGYLDSSGVFQLFCPTDTVIIVGRRPGGQTIGDYAMTRNATNPNSAPGSYSYVWEGDEPPKAIRVHQGHNGGPRIWYPGSVVRMSC